MKILFTGASSFTGFWFVKALAAAGHEIICPVTKNLAGYDGTRGQRMEKLRAFCRFIPQASFGSETFLNIIREQSFDLLCHHAADVTNYKSPDFNAQRAVENNTHNLRAVLAAMKAQGLKSVILTGTVFEKDEGAGSEPLVAASPYGLSKGLTSQIFRDFCGEAKVPLGKFVIPNPFGPFEEARFTAYLMRNWQAGKTAEVKTPDYVRDNIHADLLAVAYATFADSVASAQAPLLKINPSGYVEKQGQFTERVAREVKARTGWACEFKLLRQEDFSEPLKRVNTEPAMQFAPGWSESKSWDNFAEYYSRP
jgi:nucleoside-diphosphate-sugar epimerase